MLKAWAQLVRLPNVFTAPADVIAGAALGYHAMDGSVLPANLVCLCLISICYYAGGMILNDVADLEEDKRERPQRPLPSGRIAYSHANIAGSGLLLIGLLLGFTRLPVEKQLWESWPLLLLPVLILSYNFWFKNTWLGPFNMGLCRGCNLMLGTLMMHEVSPATYFAVVIAVLYITGVTLIAYDETRVGTFWRMTIGIVLIEFASVMLVAESCSFQSKVTPIHVYWAMAMAGLFVMAQLALWLPAWEKRTPPLIGRAIKYSIMGLIVIDTIHTMLGIGYPGLLVLLLLLPALYLGKFIYST